MKKFLLVFLLLGFAFGEWKNNISFDLIFKSVKDGPMELEMHGRADNRFHVPTNEMTNHLSNVSGANFGYFLELDAKAADDLKKKQKMNVDFVASIDGGFVFFDRFKLYALSSYENRDSFDLNMRVYVGAGAKYNYFQNDIVVAGISLIPFFAYEQYNADKKGKIGLTLSFRNKMKFTWVKDKLYFYSIVFYKPSALRWANFVIDMDNWIEVKINDVLGVRVIQRLDINQDKDVDVYSQILRFAVGLNLAF